jgi:hypothetical protein
MYFGGSSNTRRCMAPEVCTWPIALCTSCQGHGARTHTPAAQLPTEEWRGEGDGEDCDDDDNDDDHEMVRSLTSTMALASWWMLFSMRKAITSASRQASDSEKMSTSGFMYWFRYSGDTCTDAQVTPGDIFMKILSQIDRVSASPLATCAAVLLQDLVVKEFNQKRKSMKVRLYISRGEKFVSRHS